MEKWKSLGTNGKYLISNKGRVMSVFKYSSKRIDRKQGNRIMIRKPQRDKDGYVFYCLDINNTGKVTLRIHKEVFRYFVSNNFTGKDQICHSDGNKENNYSYNLYKGNQKTNTLDKYKHGITKLTATMVCEIRGLSGTMYQKDIAKIYGVQQSYISRILSYNRGIYI
jgi:hypothetical protein